MTMDLILVGVGGQGILLSSRVMGRLAMEKGRDVKVSEVHGMSQRGGDVITHVRIADKVFSPLIEEGAADAIIALEWMEAARALPFLKPGGVVITNTQRISPMPVLTGQAQYPENLAGAMEAKGKLIALDALAIAAQQGVPRAVNMVLLGAFAGSMGQDSEEWLSAVSALVPPKTIEANRRAFMAGWEAAAV